MEIGFEVKEKLAALEASLLSNHPTMPTLLRDIHSHLRKDKAIVTLMSEEEISIVVRGLSIQTATSLATATVKKAGSSSKKGAVKLSNSDVDEL